MAVKDTRIVRRGPNRRRLIVHFGSSILAGASPLLLPKMVQAARGARPALFSLRSVPGTPWKGTFSLREHVGKKPIVIAFFATWCRPCQVELPLLQAIWNEHDNRLAMVAISVDGPESAARIAPMIRRLKVKFPVVHDADSTVSGRLNPRRTVPFLITVGADGKIVGERAGFPPEHQRELPRAIKALLKR